MAHPYQDLPAEAFWRSAVAEAGGLPGAGLYRPRVAVTRQTRVATAGSCFAQHIGRSLREVGVQVLDAEPPPVPMPEAEARRFGFGVYSARYGNIYTARQLRQLLEEVAAGEVSTAVWQRDGRFHDALRPGIEPGGLDRAQEVIWLRRAHLAAVAAMLARAEVFVFTLGLTEAWCDRASGRVWPVAPGVLAGLHDPARDRFVNFTLPEVLEDLERAFTLLRGFRARMRMIVTVSPVPLAATAGGGHVLTATQQSKAILRAAAGEFAARHRGVDYFPSYEIVTAPATGGRYFSPGLREVTAEGVARVMGIFLSAQGLAGEAPQPARPPVAELPDAEELLICEEHLLGAFRP